MFPLLFYSRKGRTIIEKTLTRRTFLKLGALAGGAALLASYPVSIERYIVLVNRYRIIVPRLPPRFEGFTIVHLTDLHFGPLVPLGLIERVVHKVNSMPRDLVVCTGDYIHGTGPLQRIDTVWPLLATLKAPYGVLSVLGNHDHWGDTARSLYWLDRSGQDLRHKRRRLERNGQVLWFVGAGDLWEDHIPVESLMKPVPQNECCIVLAHNPDTADTMFGLTIDLVISGHTHGGQVNVPFVGSPVLPVKNKNYSFGLKQSIQGTPVFISKGIGWTIYPVRFNCYPEIAVLELRGSSV